MKKYIITFLFGMFLLPFALVSAETEALDTAHEVTEEELNTVDADLLEEEEAIAQQEKELSERKQRLVERRTALKELRLEWADLDKEGRQERLQEIFPKRKYKNINGERKRVGSRDALKRMLERRKMEKQEAKEIKRPQGFSSVRASFDKRRARLTRKPSNSNSSRIMTIDDSEGLEDRVRKARLRQYQRKVSRYGKRANGFEIQE